MASGEVEYKCVMCGNIEIFGPTRTGINCKSCGSRIFSKPRRSSHKIVDAI